MEQPNIYLEPTDSTPTEVAFIPRSFRHPADVRLIGRFGLTVLILSLLSLGSFVLSVFAFLRKPEMILVVTKKTVTVGLDSRPIKEEESLESVNNRQYGSANGVQLQKDQPGERDRRYAATNFVRRYMTISQAVVERSGDKVRTVRQVELKSLMKWMVPEAAQSFTRFLLQKKIIETEVQERWQATWDEQSLIQDTADPYLYRVTGRQSVTKIVNGQPIEVTRQIQFAVKLSDDPAGRREENMMTGVQPVSLDFNVLGE
jgi:hypothetical protein